jgi:hypothetical protein
MAKQMPPNDLVRPPTDSGESANTPTTPLPPASHSRLSAAVPFQPTVRPPICLLMVFDDGKTDGELIRIRGNRFVIGRTEGDFLIPHDEQISSKHLEIGRQLVAGRHRWVVSDLHSTNGLFLRVSRTVLNDRAEFLVGKGRYRFEFAAVSSSETVDHAEWTPAPTGTQGFGAVAPASALPALVEIVAGGIVSRTLLTKSECWIGSHSDCTICRLEDPFTEPTHIRLYRDSRGIWNAQNNRTLNGLWLKVPQIIVEESCLCQIGEQRLRFKVGG